MIDWFTTNGLRIIIIIAVVWLIHRFSGLLVKRAIKKAFRPDNIASPGEEQQREDTVASIINTAISVFAWIIAGMLIIQEFGVNIGPLIAGASVLGVAIGFGAQSIIKDFFAGLSIILENKFRVGDVVNIAGVSGKVEAITLRQTVLRNLDGNVHHVPNGLIDVATNMTMEFANININLGVAYDSDIKKVERVIDEVGKTLAKDSEFKKMIIEAPHFVRVNGFGASEVEIKILGKVQPGDQWAVAGEFRSRIKAAFDKNNIEIPFPQRVIHNAKQ